MSTVNSLAYSFWMCASEVLNPHATRFGTTMTTQMYPVTKGSNLVATTCAVKSSHQLIPAIPTADTIYSTGIGDRVVIDALS